MVNQLLTYSGNLVSVKCWCGIGFGIPQSLHHEAVTLARVSIHCPLGHSCTWKEQVKDEVDRLTQRLVTEQREAKFWREREQAAQRRISAAKGQATKLKKRIAAGVCPCCSRSFVDLARHMNGQHPDYVETE
jgi:hypothetical protein